MSIVPRRAEMDRPYHKTALATTREVYPTSEGTVIKAPKREHHVEVNENEVANWKEYGNERIMAPIVDWAEDYSWIEMVECYRLSYDRDHSFVRKFEGKMSDFEFRIVDLHAGNLGLHPESRDIVCIDYAEIKVDG